MRPCGDPQQHDNPMRCSSEWGAVHQVLVACNRILETNQVAVSLYDPLRGTADVFIVNNTLFRNHRRGVGIWDDHEKGKDFLECKNICCQNNLVLEHETAPVLCLYDHRRGVNDPVKPGDVKSLLKSPEWHFSFNWYESVPPDLNSPMEAFRIPPGPEDHVQFPTEVLSRKPSDPNFLRPAKDSPLARNGAGGQKGAACDPPLPAYVGAVPPEGVEPWDWDKTWKAMAR